MNIKALITATATNDEQHNFNYEAFISTMESKPEGSVFEVSLDARIHRGSQTEKWNEYFAVWSYQDYDLAVIFCNDMVTHLSAFTYIAKVMEDNPGVDVLSVSLCREDKDGFLKSEIDYTPEVAQDPNTTACLVFRKGVIEAVGPGDLMFPYEYNERDYLRRVELKGFKWTNTPMQLFYHPPQSQESIGRRGIDMMESVYKSKWGGAWRHEQYSYPYNNPHLDYL